jgi:hypothetical protein
MVLSRLARLAFSILGLGPETTESEEESCAKPRRLLDGCVPAGQYAADVCITTSRIPCCPGDPNYPWCYESYVSVHIHAVAEEAGWRSERPEAYIRYTSKEDAELGHRLLLDLFRQGKGLRVHEEHCHIFLDLDAFEALSYLTSHGIPARQF